MGDSGMHLALQGQEDSNGDYEDEDDDPSTALMRMMTTQCCCCQQFLYSKEPTIVGLPRCRSCCIWETVAHTSHHGDKGTTMRMMRTRTMTLAPPRRQRRHNVVIVNSSCTRRNPQLWVSQDAGAVAYGRQQHAPPSHIMHTPSRPSSSMRWPLLAISKRLIHLLGWCVGIHIG
jgi:hypothetical protein